MGQYISIAIDGPAGAGKSTIARNLAKKLGFIYVDTGAIYRSVGYFAWLNGVKLQEHDKVIPLLEKMNIEIKYQDGEQKIYLNNIDVSEKIRTNEMSMYASFVSSIKEVRDFLLETQRDFAKVSNVIMDGRDIGTVVLPNASVKIYLTADSKVRAKRRYDELLKKGETVDFDNILLTVIQRDEADMNREIAPLKKADDAILLDTSTLSFEESIEEIEKIIREK